MNEISDNLLSAFIEGNTTPEETERILNAAKNDAEIRAVLELSFEMDAEEDDISEEILPMSALAAKENENKCAILSELYILKKHGIVRSLEDWSHQAQLQGWLKEDGIAIHNIGRLLEQECFSISRTFHNDIDMLSHALSIGDVIAVVDGNELTTDHDKQTKEEKNDIQLGLSPNHAIVITSIDKDIVSYYEPSTGNVERIPVERFMDAWEDSTYYMVTISPRCYANYEPHPIDLSDVRIPEELNELKEAIAENAHEVWAQGRKAQGWSYGPERNDSLKQTPDMVPYSDLTDEEKFFDREMAMNTIKLLKKLGYRIVKD